VPKSITSISGRFLDFWLLGGASIVLYCVMAMGLVVRHDSILVQQKFMLMIPVFSFFSVLCNNPHFIVSYHLGYSRGFPFIRKYWIALIAVPLALIGLYTFAYFDFNKDLSLSPGVQSANRTFENWGLTYRFGESSSLGKELLSLSIWLMYLTVGWHYSKQVYGCMMVYSRFDKLNWKASERMLIRVSLLLLACYQFVYTSQLMDISARVGYTDPRFVGISILPLGLPAWIMNLSIFLAGGSFLSVCAIFVRKILTEKRMPSPVFWVCWLSLYFWWVQVLDLPEYYYLAVPFFHSLQYLPFAYKMERYKIADDRWTSFSVSWRVLVIIGLGVLFFEWIPWALDQGLDTGTLKTAWFFAIAFAVFINIHHFFIDSVSWRLQQPALKKGLFTSSSIIDRS
jgi:hypothetical protein